MVKLIARSWTEGIHQPWRKIYPRKSRMKKLVFKTQIYIWNIKPN
jgi:hypothetical protein